MLAMAVYTYVIAAALPTEGSVSNPHMYSAICKLFIMAMWTPDTLVSAYLLPARGLNTKMMLFHSILPYATAPRSNTDPMSQCPIYFKIQWESVWGTKCSDELN